MSKGISTHSQRPSGLTPEQVYYLQNVLGVESVLLPFAEAEAPSQRHRQTGDSRQAKFHVLVATESSEFPLDGEAGELAVKMLQAMKVPLGEITIVEWTNSASCPSEIFAIANEAKCILVMGTAAAASFSQTTLALGEFGQWNDRKIFVTYSPNELLREPSFKKTAWSHLQAFMKVLSA